MGDEVEIKAILNELEGLCPAGYALAFHVRFATPTFLFQTYSDEWIDIYSQKGFVMVDPTVRWGFENTGAIRWSDLADDDPSDVLATAARHGLKYGFAYAMDSGGSRSMTSYARGDREFTDDEIATISELAEQLHRRTSRLGSLSPETADELRRMSIRVTHPGAVAH